MTKFAVGYLYKNSAGQEGWCVEYTNRKVLKVNACHFKLVLDESDWTLVPEVGKTYHVKEMQPAPYNREFVITLNCIVGDKAEGEVLEPSDWPVLFTIVHIDGVTWEPWTPEQPAQSAQPGTCSCSTRDLMARGCVCGAIKRTSEFQGLHETFRGGK